VKSRRWLAVIVGIAFAVGLLTRLWAEPQPADVAAAPPPVEAAAPLVPPAPAPVAVAVAPSAASAEPPKAAVGQFQEGFCAPEGDETARPVRLLLKLLRDEFERRRALRQTGFEAEETALMQVALGASELSVDDRLQQALQLAQRHPNSQWPQVMIALLAKASGRTEVELAALRRARVLVPHEPSLGLAIALATRFSPELDEAIDGLSDFLASEDAPPLARLRARLEVQRDIQQPFSRRSRAGITMLWPPDALSSRQADEVMLAIDQALTDAARLVGSSRRDALTVVVYPGRSELLAVSCVPTWAGGLYDGTLRLVAAPGDPLGVRAKTLLHETLHAQLSPLASSAPKWFQEGVAQAFAKEGEQAWSQWALMVRTHVWVPFDSLDGSFTVLSSGDAQLAYAQSLGMVDFLQERCGPGALAEAIVAFQGGATTPAALARACHREIAGAELLEFLAARLSARPRSVRREGREAE
jgi:hypothetical protein